MTKLYHRISTFLSGCRVFITSISFAIFSFGSTACSLSRGLWRAISALAPKFLPEKAVWLIVERMCSESVREKINVFGRHPRNTGALCSPLL